MTKEDIDTSRFMYDPEDERSWGQLLRYEEFSAKDLKLTLKKIIPYIIYMYDPASTELEKEYPYLPQRKMAVAKMVGMIDRKHVPRAVEEILIGKVKEVNNMIVKYLQLSGSIDVLMLATYKEVASELSKKAMSGDINSQTVKTIDLVKDSINNLQTKLLKGKDETTLRSELYIQIEGKGLGLRVEDIAEKLLKGEDIFPEANPYDNYSVQNMYFVDDK